MLSNSYKVTLEQVSIEKWHLLDNLIQLYAYDFSEFTNSEISGCGKYNLSGLPRYHWTGTNPDPFLVKVNKNTASFIMLKYIVYEKVKRLSLAEFFILRKYRKKGIGNRSAQIVLDKFSGEWYLDILSSNKPAITFWKKVIKEYTQDNYVQTNDDKKTYITFEK